MALDELAIWDAPHTFVRGDTLSASHRRITEILGEDLLRLPAAERDARMAKASEPGPEWQRVFSYGLLLPETRELHHEERRQGLAARWGLDETERLADAETKLLRRDTSIDSWWFEPFGFAEFVTAVTRAADRGERVPGGFEDRMRSFLDFVERPDRFVWRWDQLGTSRVRTPRYDTLLERLAIEFDHLVTRRPRLARCKLCGRAFVPLRQSRPERTCRANLWLSVDSGRRIVPPVQLERCVALDESERLRTRKRLEQRHRRAIARFGAKHPEVTKAKRELGEFAKRNPPVLSGRQAAAQAQYIEAPHEKGDQDG